MIRKSGLFLVLLFIILIILFNFIFANLLLKNALIKTGELIFGAKTEIKSVNFKIFSGKIDIKNLTVGDKKNEFKNLFEISKISFGIKIAPLFSKKIIIDNIEVENLALSTDRKTSGFLPPKKQKKVEKENKPKKPGIFEKLTAKIEEKAKQEIKKLPVSKLSDLKDIKNIDIKDKIKLENLESIKVINESKKEIEEQKENTKKNIENLNLQKRADLIKQKAEKIKEFKVNSVQDIPEAQNRIKELDEIKKELETLNKDVNNAKNQITGFSNYVNEKIKEINQAKEKDVENVMKNININLLNANELEKAIIGPVWYERIKTVINLFNLAKRYIPEGGKKSKKENKVIEKQRKKGTEVVFVKQKVLPSFWIKKIKFSADKSAAKGFYLNGYINDICTEQAIIEKPMIFSLEAKDGKKFYSLKGKIDHIEEVKDVIELKAEGLEGKIIGIDKVDLGNVKIKDGNVGFELTGKNIADTISISGKINMNNLTYEKKEEDITYQVLNNIDKINIFLSVNFANELSTISINSDILEKIKKAIEKIYGKKIAEIKERINKELETKTKEKIKELTETITKDKKELEKILNADIEKIKSVEDYIQNIKNNILKQIKDSQGKAIEDKKKDILKMFK